MAEEEGGCYLAFWLPESIVSIWKPFSSGGLSVLVASILNVLEASGSRDEVRELLII